MCMCKCMCINLASEGAVSLSNTFLCSHQLVAALPYEPLPLKLYNNYIMHTQCSLQVPATVGAGWYAVALQVEDFATTSSTTPMSSVPIQFLVNVFTSSASCGNKPNFTSPPTPRDGDTFGIALGDTWEVTIIAVTSGPGVR